jgi:hypothetical protein
VSKTAKIILAFLLVDALAVGGYFLARSLRGGSGPGEAAWKVIGPSYRPANAVEEFIQSDAANRGSLPVMVRDHGRDAKALRRFKGRQFAHPSERVLALFFKGLDDWMIMDIKYTAENGREATRTVLYVLDGGQWKVGDTGSLGD